MSIFSRPLGDRVKLQALIFLLIWPGFNWIFASTVLITFEQFAWARVIEMAVRIWMVFIIAFAALKLFEKITNSSQFSERLWLNILAHIALFIAVFSLFAPVEPVAKFNFLPRVNVFPLVLLIMEVTLYVSVLHIFEAQQKAFKTKLMLTESELNVLRAQGNPHFLFNTLNLIASEIKDESRNAREIIYDLSDLLRSSVELANQKFVSVSEELNWVRLFLVIQQKRFSDRLSFRIEAGNGTEDLKIPSLLLQSAIENTVKHAVASNPATSNIVVATSVQGKQLQVTITDTGLPFDDTSVSQGEGLRIIRKTLDLHYSENYQLSLKSTENGGIFSIVIPAEQYELPQGEEH